MGHVGRDHGIHLGLFDATTGQRRFDPVGIFPAAARISIMAAQSSLRRHARRTVARRRRARPHHSLRRGRGDGGGGRPPPGGRAPARSWSSWDRTGPGRHRPSRRWRATGGRPAATSRCWGSIPMADHRRLTGRMGVMLQTGRRLSDARAHGVSSTYSLATTPPPRHRAPARPGRAARRGRAPRGAISPGASNSGSRWPWRWSGRPAGGLPRRADGGRRPRGPPGHSGGGGRPAPPGGVRAAHHARAGRGREDGRSHRHPVLGPGGPRRDARRV